MVTAVIATTIQVRRSAARLPVAYAWSCCQVARLWTAMVYSSCRRRGKEAEMIYGLTSLGAVHTAISLVAVAAGIVALVRYGEISPRNLTGQVYVVTTVLTC